MTTYERPRMDPIAGHAYTLPVVREVPIPGALSVSVDPHGSEPAPVYAADSHAW